MTRTTTNDKGTRFCVTINTHDEDPEGHDLQQSIDQIERLFEDGLVTYAIGSYERGGESNRLHLQVWVILKRQSRIGWFTSQVNQSYAEVQRAHDDDKACLYACNPAKEGWISKAFEFGERPSKGAGRRTDIETIQSAIVNGDVRTYQDVSDMNPGVAARYSNWVNWRLAVSARAELDTMNRYAATYHPKVWQHWLARYLLELPADERKIIFVVDKLGNAGKTRFCSEFKRSSGLRVQSLRPGRAADMAASLEIRTEVLFIDVPRSRNEYISHVYSFMEEAKDGEVFSPKFNSHYKPLPNCHIVMFTNSDVDIGDVEESDYWRNDIPANVRWQNGGVRNYLRPHGPPLSHDRYAIWDLTPEMNEQWSDDNELYGDTCPPFRTYDSEMRIAAPYHPPFVPSSGPEFNGDIAGDGPDTFMDAYQVHAYTSDDESVDCVVLDSQATILEQNSILRDTLSVPLLGLYLNKGEFRQEGAIDWDRWDLNVNQFTVELSFDRNNPDSCPAVCTACPNEYWLSCLEKWIARTIRCEQDWFDRVENATESMTMGHYINLDQVIRSGRYAAAELTKCRFGDLNRDTMEQFTTIRSSGALLVHVVELVPDMLSYVPDRDEDLVLDTEIEYQNLNRFTTQPGLE